MNPISNSIYQSSDTDPFKGDMYLISGKLSRLRTAPGKVNLLSALQSTMGVAGAGNAIGGMHGAVANAAMLSSYDGADITKFVGRIGEHDVIGNFETVNFKDGDMLEAVVSRIDDSVSFVHAVVRPSDNWLWMPFSINKGRKELAKAIAKLCGGIGVVGWIFLLIMFYFSPSEDIGFLKISFLMSCALAAFATVIGYLTYRSSIDDGLYAERILKVLGFKAPRTVDLEPYCLAEMTMKERYPHADRHIYMLNEALAAYGSSRAVSTK